MPEWLLTVLATLVGTFILFVAKEWFSPYKTSYKEREEHRRMQEVEQEELKAMVEQISRQVSEIITRIDSACIKIDAIKDALVLTNEIGREFDEHYTRKHQQLSSERTHR